MKLAAKLKDNVRTEDLRFDYDTRMSGTEDTDSGNAAEVGFDLVDSVTGSILGFTNHPFTPRQLIQIIVTMNRTSHLETS